MVIVYCEKCGRRIPDEQFQSGQAVRSSDERCFCKDCSSALPKAERAVPAEHLPALKSRLTRPARATPVSQGFDRNWLYIGGGAVALIACAAILFRPAASPHAPNQAATVPKPSPAPLSTAPTASAPGTRTHPKAREESPKSTPKELATEAAALRQRDSEREFEQMRLQRAMRLLEDARAYLAAKPDDPWGYKDQLERLANSYRGSQPADEAAKLLAALNLGPRPAPPPPPPAALPESWTGPADAEGWKPVLDGKSPPFRSVGFGSWKYDNGSLVTSAKVGDQTNFAFADGQVRIRLQLEQSSWFAVNFRQSDSKVGYGVGFDRKVLEPLWGKPLELLATCKGDEVSVIFNGQSASVDPGGRSTEGRIHISNAVGTIRIFSIDYRPLDAIKK